MERIGHRGNRPHASLAGFAGAWFLVAQAFGAATPLTPDPRLEEPGRLRVGFLTNQFQTDPLQTRSVVRHPFAFGLETSVSDRLAVEGVLSDGIGLGLKVGLLDENESPVDFGIGFDQLLFPWESHLFGRDSVAMIRTPGRAWVGLAQTWKFVRARSVLSVQPVVDGLEFVPHFAVETAFHLPVSLGWETSWEDDEFRQTLGLSARLKTLEVSGGLSEFQSWIFRNGAFGWFGSPPTGKTDGIGNPGWWFSVKWDLPPLRPVPSPGPMPVVQCPAPVVDGNAMQPVVELLQQRLTQEDVAELAERSESSITSNPVTMAVLRRRILSGGPSARKALWRIALDTNSRVADRRQAVVTLEGNIQDEDLQGLAGLAEDRAADLRLEAAMGLGQIETAESTKMIKRLALDPEESVRLAAQAVLEGRAAKSK